MFSVLKLVELVMWLAVILTTLSDLVFTTYACYAIVTYHVVNFLQELQEILGWSLGVNKQALVCHPVWPTCSFEIIVYNLACLITWYQRIKAIH